MSEGVVYGNYFLLGRLAQGGMAEIFLGKRLDDTQTGALLAIKRMLPRLSGDQDFVAMFSDEARIARNLSHPHICRVFDEGEHLGQLFLVMEFIHGKDLRVVQRRAEARHEPIPYRYAAHVIARIAEALDYAHQKTNERGEPENIVHRDVSPQNILISYDGVPKLIDFGIAKARDRVVQTRVGVVKGKFAYMSPEQATGLTLDGRADIFSLGVVLYELLTGKLPFQGSSDLSTLQRIARAEYTPPILVNSALPQRLCQIIERAMSRDRNDRYASALELATDLDSYLADESREVSAGSLSAFMRKLFRDDYIRELTRIKTFAAVRPNAQAPTASPMPDTSGEQAIPVIEKTFVTPSLFLAAGYDAAPELLAEVAASLTSPGTDIVLSATDVLEEPERLTNQPAPFANLEDMPTGDATNQIEMLPAEKTPAADGLWDNGPTTDETPAPNPWSLRSSAATTQEVPVAAPEPPEIDALATQAMSASEIRAIIDQAQASVAIAPESPFNPKTVEVTGTVLGELGLPALEPIPVPQAVAAESTHPAPDENVDDFEIVEASRVVELSGVTQAAPAMTSDKDTRRLDDEEVGEIVAEARLSESLHARAEADSNPEEFDDCLTANGGLPLPAQLPTVPRPTPRPTPPRADVLEPRLTPTSSEARRSTKPFELGSPENPSQNLPLIRRPQLLTDLEIAVLILAAALGLVLVVGAYWYASTMPIETKSTTTQIEPLSGSAPPIPHFAQ